MLNCTTGTMESSHFSKWTPLTGMYIAATTLVCATAMIGDLVKGLRSKLYWIPSRYVSLNSISLTILGTATKLSMDLGTPMPRHIDQLAKLGTSAFMCVALATIHPSLGKLENRELLSNAIALHTLVISSIVGLCIQLRTGVIYTFKTSHIIMLTMMSLLLLHCVLSIAFLLGFKSYYQMNYEEQDQSARKKWVNVEDSKHVRTEKLKQYLKRFSILAYYSCPHFLLGRSSLGIPPMIYGLIPAAAFFVTCVTSMFRGDIFLASTLGSHSSDYNWSVSWICITQTIGLGVGVIVLCMRGCYITMVYLKGADSLLESEQHNSDLVADQYIFHYTIYSQHKSLVCKLKMIILSRFLALLRTFLVFTSSLTMMAVELFWMCITGVCFVTCLWPCRHPTAQHEDLELDEEELSRLNVNVVPGGEAKGSIKWMMKSILHVTQKFMSVKERNTEYIEELLGQYLSDFRGVVSFVSEEVAPLDASQGSTPNGWSLPIVILTSIAIALPNVDPHSIDKLVKGVNQGLVFVKLIEEKFNNHPRFINVCCAAYDEWINDFGPSFAKIERPAFQNNNPIEILKSIAISARDDFQRSSVEKKVAAHCKYRLCETLLMEHTNENERTTQLSCERLFEKLRTSIVDILGACLTNLKYYVLMECSKNSSIEKLREAAPSILTFVGDTEKIMEIIETREIPEMSWEKMVFIDNWRQYYHDQRQLP